MLFFAFMLLKKRTKLDSADLPLDTSKAFSAPLERYISLKPQTHCNTSKKTREMVEMPKEISLLIDLQNPSFASMIMSCKRLKMHWSGHHCRAEVY